MNQNEYVRRSLELHLFFGRIMKEHSLFLEVAFLEKDNELKSVARDFQNKFSEILNIVITLANNNVSNDFLEAKEIVTDNTLEAEEKTSSLSGIPIDMNITRKELNLRNGNLLVTEQLVKQITNINKQALPLIENIIYFKKDILDRVLSCSLYTTNYPLLITHIRNEAKMYHKLLMKIINYEEFTDNYILEQELFWNNIMKEHAKFIRGLLDPSEDDLILTANKFALDYDDIIEKYSDSNMLTKISLEKTLEFKKFKITGEEGILNCNIKSIIIPLLADHVLREANHFIRILKSASND